MSTPMPTGDADQFALYSEIDNFLDLAAELYRPEEVVPVLEALVRQYKERIEEE